jgi:hypothetical protein
MTCKIERDPRVPQVRIRRNLLSLPQSLRMDNKELEKLFNKRLSSHPSIQQGETKRSRK